MSAITQFFLYPVSPILALVAAACLGLIVECISTERLRSVKRLVMILGPIASLACTFLLWKDWPIDFVTTGYSESAVWLKGFASHYRVDQTALVFFAGVSVFTLLSLLTVTAYTPDAELDTEIPLMTLFVAAGMMVLISADSLLMIFLGLELMSLPTYVLVGIRRKDRYSCEAALKYFLFGSFATVFLVLGMTLIYAKFGTMRITELSQLIAALPAETGAQGKVLLFGGLTLMLVATLFKVGVAPFHMWVPDAYEGAPAVITGFMGSAIKLAGFGLAMRLLWTLFPPLSATWIPIISILAVATLFIGNIAALNQDNLKRMFAYSSVGHAGYLLLSLAAIPTAGTHSSSILYYLLVYGFMFLGLFAILAALENQQRGTQIQSVAGLGFTQPWLGASLALFALSAAGIPPTAGFLAKYFIFMEVLRAGQTGYVVLAVIGSLIGVYYYLRVLVFLYMKEGAPRVPLTIPRRVKLCIFICASAVLLFAVVPQLLGLGSFLR